MCPALERARSGTWICGSRAFRGTSLVQEFPANWAAVSGDVVRVASDSQLLRYRDTVVLLFGALLQRFWGNTRDHRGMSAGARIRAVAPAP
jgi:hypothetical protein